MTAITGTISCPLSSSSTTTTTPQPAYVPTLTTTEPSPTTEQSSAIEPSSTTEPSTITFTESPTDPTAVGAQAGLIAAIVSPFSVIMIVLSIVVLFLVSVRVYKRRSRPLQGIHKPGNG